jgi:UDP-N-acetylglucosamine 3-dehydrogenase
MIKVGVIGVGAMGQHHARIYSQANCTLVGVADANPEQARAVAGKYKTDYYADYHDLLSKVDAVSIAVPTTLHHAIAMDSLKARVHCLVEKPIASSLDEADDMIIAAENNRVNLAVGHIERFNPAVMRLKQLLDEGALGKILTICTRRVGPFVPRIRDVGIIIDSATHDIGVIRYLVGKDPVRIYSRAGRLKHSKEDHAIIILDFDDAIACIEVNWFTPQKVRTLNATGSEGIAYLDYIHQTLRIEYAQEGKVIGIRQEEPLKLEIEDFLRSVEERSKPAVDGIEGRAILKISLESCESGLYHPRTLEKVG